MANLYDYITWRGDLTFDERPFNDVDNLILSELCYAEMEDIVPTDSKQISLEHLNKRYIELGYVSELVNNPKETLELTARSERFKDIGISDYINVIDHDREIQFSAVTFHLPDGTLYVAYRGTDNTIVGWREDFNFSFKETAGQEEAKNYLERVANNTNNTNKTNKIIVGGHSKGGNLAVYAAAFADKEVRDSILQVYSNDGPGFNDSISKNPQYLSSLGKVKLIIPSFSVVGILLNNKSERTVIKSDATGPMQHSPLTWQVNASSFEEVDEQDPSSIFLDEALGQWIDSMDDQEKMALVSSIFDSLDASGASTVHEIKKGKSKAYFAIAKAFMKIDSTRKSELSIILKKLASAGMNVAKEDLKTTFEDWWSKRH